MLVRYGKDNRNKTVRLAEIYTKEEHKIDNADIDRDALHITGKLNSFGYEAYIVGGAVRDLLAGKKPNDFDIVTNALPGRIRKIFRNSRIIGRRFKLVHIYYGKLKNIEVSTFRSLDSSDTDNIYGTIDEDVTRRDFSINALYYCPRREQLFDYIGGVKDLRSRRIRSLIPIQESINEDPVRMIRALKYSAALNFRLDMATKRYIRKFAYLLESCSSSRLTEELFKILKSGNTFRIFSNMVDFHMFRYFQPAYWKLLQENKNVRQFFNDLKTLDSYIDNSVGEEIRPRCIALYAKQAIDHFNNVSNDQIHKQYYLKIKEIILPLTPPNADVDDAVKMILQEKGIRHIRQHYHKKKAVSR